MLALRAQVLIPTSQFVRSLVAARLAADVSGVPTVLIARTDAHSANLLTADVDERDQPFIHGERTPEGFHQFNGGIKVLIRICPSVRCAVVQWTHILQNQISMLVTLPKGFAFAMSHQSICHITVITRGCKGRCFIF